jgi:hypothetical protein
MKKGYFFSLSILKNYLEFMLLFFSVIQLNGQIYSDPRFLGRQAELKRENRFEEALILLDSQLDSLRSIPDHRPAIENRLMKADIYRMQGQYNLSELMRHYSGFIGQFKAHFF